MGRNRGRDRGRDRDSFGDTTGDATGDATGVVTGRPTSQGGQADLSRFIANLCSGTVIQTLSPMQSASWSLEFTVYQTLASIFVRAKNAKRGQGLSEFLSMP